MIKSIVILEFVIFGILIVLLVTQIIVPTIQGTPLFPLFRKRARDVENKVAIAREDLEIAERRAELSKLKDRKPPNQKETT